MNKKIFMFLFIILSLLFASCTNDINDPDTGVDEVYRNSIYIGDIIYSADQKNVVYKSAIEIKSDGGIKIAMKSDFGSKDFDIDPYYITRNSSTHYEAYYDNRFSDDKMNMTFLFKNDRLIFQNFIKSSGGSIKTMNGELIR